MMLRLAGLGIRNWEFGIGRKTHIDVLWMMAINEMIKIVGLLFLIVELESAMRVVYGKSLIPNS